MIHHWWLYLLKDMLRYEWTPHNKKWGSLGVQTQHTGEAGLATMSSYKASQWQGCFAIIDSNLIENICNCNAVYVVCIMSFLSCWVWHALKMETNPCHVHGASRHRLSATPHAGTVSPCPFTWSHDANQFIIRRVLALTRGPVCLRSMLEV